MGGSFSEKSSSHTLPKSTSDGGGKYSHIGSGCLSKNLCGPAGSLLSLVLMPHGERPLHTKASPRTPSPKCFDGPRGRRITFSQAKTASHQADGSDDCQFSGWRRRARRPFDFRSKPDDMCVRFCIFSSEKISLQVWRFRNRNLQTCNFDKSLLLSTYFSMLSFQQS